MGVSFGGRLDRKGMLALGKKDIFGDGILRLRDFGDWVRSQTRRERPKNCLNASLAEIPMHNRSSPWPRGPAYFTFGAICVLFFASMLHGGCLVTEHSMCHRLGLWGGYGVHRLSLSAQVDSAHRMPGGYGQHRGSVLHRPFRSFPA